jgi:hypothetical protein
MLKTVSSITNAIGALNYSGTWDAATNTPTITSSVGTKGDYYVVSVDGSTNINGISNWGVGDWIVFNGAVWQRVEGGEDLNGVNLVVSGNTTLSGLTASTALALDANKNAVSVANTGTGDNVLATSPTLVTPALGAATATSVNKVALTAPATGSTLTIADGKTLTANNSLTFAGTDATTMTFPTTNATVARTDATQTFTGAQLFSTGAAATPSIAHAGNTDTGVYFETNKVNIATGGALRAQVDGSRLTMGGARNEAASFASRYPAALWLWGDTGFQSFSARLANFKNNAFTSGVAVDILSIAKGAGFASSSVIGQLGGVLRISMAAQYTGGTNIAEVVEIPFSLSCRSTNNIEIATGTQRIVTSLNNTGGGSNSYALTLSATSNTAATLALTITRSGLANNHVMLEVDVVTSSDSAGRIMIPAII